MTIYEIVKTKINNDSISELDLTLAIDEVEQTIKNYCNIDVIPNALNYVWANMTVDLLKYNYELNTNDEIVTDLSDVSSVRVGDTQIQLGGGNSQRTKILNSHMSNLDDIVMNYREQLNKFKRMVW